MANNPNNTKNIEAHKWKKGQSGNPKGRTPRGIPRNVLEEIKEMGYEAVTPERIIEWYGILMGMPLSKVQEIAGNPKSDKDSENDFPAFVRVLAVNLLSGKNNLSTVLQMTNRVVGMPRSQVDLGLSTDPSIVFLPPKEKDE